MNKWDQHYAARKFIFDTESHDSVRRVRPYLPVAGRVLGLATGEGRNGVSLAQRGLSAEGVDSSPAAVVKAEKVIVFEGVGFAVRVVDIIAMRMPPGHYVIIGSVCCYLTEPVRSRLTRGVVDALVSNGLFIDVFYHPEQATLEKGSKDQTVPADMVEPQTAFGGLEWLIAEHCHTGKGEEVRSTACLLRRKTLSDGI